MLLCGGVLGFKSGVISTMKKGLSQLPAEQPSRQTAWQLTVSSEQISANGLPNIINAAKKRSHIGLPFNM